MAMGVGLRGCVRRDSNESVIHYLHDADARVFIRAETAKQPFVQIAALVKVGSWTKPLARHWRLLRSFYLLI
tara:strand:+ start:4664 stop:4879 length:216 start_codon:yes stop_codon:yes gene_type:complete